MFKEDKKNNCSRMCFDRRKLIIINALILKNKVNFYLNGLVLTYRVNFKLNRLILKNKVNF